MEVSSVTSSAVCCVLSALKHTTADAQCNLSLSLSLLFHTHRVSLTFVAPLSGGSGTSEYYTVVWCVNFACATTPPSPVVFPSLSHCSL